jgi:hypothetical protein
MFFNLHVLFHQGIKSILYSFKELIRAKFIIISKTTKVDFQGLVIKLPYTKIPFYPSKNRVLPFLRIGENTSELLWKTKRRK